MENTIQKRLAALREEMQNNNIDAWYISGTDPHSSEYLPDRWQTRSFISGFTGSYGVVVVTQTEAALWTDTRYFIQAEEQLEGTGISMMRLRVPDAIAPETWLSEKLEAGSTVGMDAKTVSVDGFKCFQTVLEEKNIMLKQTPDFFNSIWANRPEDSLDPVFELGVEHAGISRKKKQQQLGAELELLGADYHVVTMLDELAWIYNLRGTDINYNPVFTACAVIGKNESFLFVNSRKVMPELQTKLQEEGVEIKEYSEFYTFLSQVKGKKVYADLATLNYAAYDGLNAQNEILNGTSIIALLKARKNYVEQEGFKQAMQKDGVALIAFLFWLKNTIGQEQISEFDIGVKLREFRAKQSDFKGESFPPIVGYKSHGAIVHLSVGKEDALQVDAEGILLFDSGGQYLNGTTDITRTVALGEVSSQQKTDYTLVLKGMIALSMVKFPYGTKGCHIDVLARQALWSRGMNYGHGTGHGVGHFLNVHEGPMAIRQEFNENKIEPGHVMSNEPAFYREGQYGIRTENMMVCVDKESTEFGRFLGFETLTLCPIDTSLIDKQLLNEAEKEWLNNYHAKVKMELRPLLNGELQAFLDEITKPI